MLLRLKLLRWLKLCLGIFSGSIRLAWKDSLIRLKDYRTVGIWHYSALSLVYSQIFQ